MGAGRVCAASRLGFAHGSFPSPCSTLGWLRSVPSGRDEKASRPWRGEGLSRHQPCCFQCHRRQPWNKNGKTGMNQFSPPQRYAQAGLCLSNRETTMIRSTRTVLCPARCRTRYTLAASRTRPAPEVVECKAKDTLTVGWSPATRSASNSAMAGRLRSSWRTPTRRSSKVVPGGIIYRFSASVRIDGQPMTLEQFCLLAGVFLRALCRQRPARSGPISSRMFSTGFRFDTREGNLRCRPHVGRLALQDASLRICPEEVNLWIEHEPSTLDVGQCYNGDDCYLGPYLGEACHVGMDINQPKGRPVHPDRAGYPGLFQQLAMGHNNRWRDSPLGKRRRVGPAKPPPDQIAHRRENALGLRHEVRDNRRRPRRQP